MTPLESRYALLKRPHPHPLTTDREQPHPHPPNTTIPPSHSHRPPSPPQAIRNSFNTTIPTNIKPDPTEMNPHYQKWQDYAASRPAATSNAFHTTGLWFLYNMLNTLLSNALVTSGVAIASSFIILMFVTMNVVTSILVRATMPIPPHTFTAHLHLHLRTPSYHALF